MADLPDYRHVVQVFDAGKDDGFYWYAMEYIPGSLADYLGEPDAEKAGIHPPDHRCQDRSRHCLPGAFRPPAYSTWPYCMSGIAAGEIDWLLRKNNYAAARSITQSFIKLFGKNCFFLELQRYEGFVQDEKGRGIDLRSERFRPRLIPATRSGMAQTGAPAFPWDPGGCSWSAG